MTQQQMNLEHIITLKDETIDDLKHKCASLELTNTNQYRESIRKEAEFERVVGQVSELSRNIDQKDQKISELHRSIQDMLKTNV
jgi:predicted RNase H-like nuclease (RuvC/YqgF family)